MVLFFMIAATAAVAWANGANANFKGVASLYGSGTASYANCVRWAAVTTAAGAFVSMLLGSGMVQVFSGRGLVPAAVAGQSGFLLAVALGAALAGAMATRFGFPVSTTHLLTGALTGAGLVHGGGVSMERLRDAFLLPLFLSPALAVLAGAAVHSLLRITALLPASRNHRIDTIHFLSAGAVCFARGLNDTPKIAALLGSAPLALPAAAPLTVATAMTAGGLTGARQVAETLGHRITDMNPSEGFAANLATALLVTTASFHALPVSTTHVSVGALLGIGIMTGKARWRTTLPVLAAWGLTLPAGAAAAAVCFALIRALGS